MARQPGTDATPDVAARSEATEQMRSILKRIARLPRQQQDVVALCVWSRLSYEEAAVALGVPVGTVKRHATGKGNAGKDEMIAAARARGFSLADDNEADAIAILLWAIETRGGVR